MTAIPGHIDSAFGTFLYRLMGAVTLDASTYEGVEADRHATWQAAATVVLASTAAGIGAGGLAGLQLSIFLKFTVLAAVTWLAWAMLMFQIGTRLLPETETRATLGELLRTTGFAAAPGLLQVFAILPGMLLPVFVASWLWMFAAMIVGVGHALDYRSGVRALLVCLIAAGLAVAMALAFGVLLGPRVS